MKKIKYNIVRASDSGDILLIVESDCSLAPGDPCAHSSRAEQSILLLVCNGTSPIPQMLLYWYPPPSPANSCRLPECDIKVICRQGMLFLAR